MSRTARLFAATLLATGLAVTVPAASASAGGWDIVGTFPTKGECIEAGLAGDGVKWDDWRCSVHIEPLSVQGNSGWDLAVIIYRG